MKQLSDTTYRIQHLSGNRSRQRKVVHFDRLKPCTTAVNQTGDQRQTAPAHDQLMNAAPSAHSPPTIGTTIKLLDDDDETTPAPSLTPSLPLSTAPPSQRRYPARSHQPPTRYGDSVIH